MTPEGHVKKLVRDVLDKYKPRLYYHMPVHRGYGKPSLDFVGWFGGIAFAIETKAAGKAPSDRQKATMQEMAAAGATIFVIDGAVSLVPLRKWLEVREMVFNRATSAP